MSKEKQIELLEKQLAFWKHHCTELANELKKEEEIANHYAEMLDKTEEELNTERVKNEKQGYRKQSEWISVEERLPTDRELVLVSSMDLFTKKHGWFYLARYTNLQNDGVRFDDKRWLSEDGGIFGRVTHWMPLPEPPKGGAE